MQNFPIANIKQFQYPHAVQHQVTQFLVDLNIEKNKRLKLCKSIRQPEDELTQWRRQVNEPSPSSFPIPLRVDPPCAVAFQDNCTLNNAQISMPSITITLKRASSTTSKSQLPDQPRGSAPSLPTSRPSSSALEGRVKQLEEVSQARNCRETNISIYRSQFTFLYDTFRTVESGGSDTILWKLSSLRLVFDTAKSAARLDDAAANPRTHYISPVYRTHPHGYSFFVHFYQYVLDSAAANPTSFMFAFFPGDYDGLWPRPSLKRFIFQSAINLTPRINGLSPSHPPRRYQFEGLPENHVLL